MNEREIIDKTCAEMKEGQEARFDHFTFSEAFPCGFPSIYNTHEEAFLSSRIGSAWGTWKVRQDPITHDYIISRHVAGDKRVYVDPDRAHLFNLPE